MINTKFSNFTVNCYGPRSMYQKVHCQNSGPLAVMKRQVRGRKKKERPRLIIVTLYPKYTIRKKIFFTNVGKFKQNKTIQNVARQSISLAFKTQWQANNSMRKICFSGMPKSILQIRRQGQSKNDFSLSPVVK